MDNNSQEFEPAVTADSDSDDVTFTEEDFSEISKAETLELLEDMLKLTSHYENLNAQMEEIEESIKEIEAEDFRDTEKDILFGHSVMIKKKTHMLALVFAAIIGGVCLFLALGTYNPPTFILLLFTVFSYFILKLLINRALMKSKKVSLRIESEKLEFDKRKDSLAELKKMLEETNEVKDELFFTFRPYIDTFLPMNYCIAHIISKLIEYLRNRRADNLKEAINLYETDTSN